MAHLVAQGVNRGASLGGIFRDELEMLAIDIDRVAIDVTGDLLKGFGRDADDFGEPEVEVAKAIVLADEVIGVAVADAGIVVAELFPGEAEVIEHAGVAHLLEALSASRGATAGDGGKGVLEAGPGAEIPMFFRCP